MKKMYCCGHGSANDRICRILLVWISQRSQSGVFWWAAGKVFSLRSEQILSVLVINVSLCHRLVVRSVYLKGNFCQSKGQVLSLFLQDPGRKLLLRLKMQQGRREDDTHSIHKDISGVLDSILGLSIGVEISNVWYGLNSFIILLKSSVLWTDYL